MARRKASPVPSHDAVDSKESWKAITAALEDIAGLHAQAPQTSEEIQALIATMTRCLGEVENYRQSTLGVARNGHLIKLEDSELVRLREKLGQLDREGVMLWNRLSALRHLFARDRHDRADQDNEHIDETTRLKLSASTDIDKQTSLALKAKLIATGRFLASRLIDAGTPPLSLDKPNEDIPPLNEEEQAPDTKSSALLACADAARLIDLYSKAAIDLAECDQFADCQGACERTAELEPMAKAKIEASTGHQMADKPTIQGLPLVYYLARACLAFGQKNWVILEYMLKQASDAVARGDGPWRDFERLVDQLYNFARALLTKVEAAVSPPSETEEAQLPGTAVDTSKKKANKYRTVMKSRIGNKTSASDMEHATKWLQKALSLLDKLSENTYPPKIAELVKERVRANRIKVLRSLSQAFLSAACPDVARAEASLDELLKLDRSFVHLHHKLYMIIQREAGDNEIREVLVNCAKIAPCTLKGIGGLVKSVHQLPATRKFLARHLLQELMKVLFARNDDAGTSWVYLPLVALCIGLDYHDNCAEQLAMALRLCQEQCSLPFRLSPEAAFACQSHIWKLGDAHLKKAQFASAVRWYRLVTNPVFAELASNFPRANRKLALCLMRDRDFDSAVVAVMANHPPSASDLYIRFLCATMQDDVAEAEHALEAMVAAPDFESDMLVWAAKQALEYGLHSVYRLCLRTLIRLAREGALQQTAGSDYLLLVRALIKHSTNELSENATTEHVQALIEEFQAAWNIVQDRCEQLERSGPLESADDVTLGHVAWIYKSAVSMATQHIDEAFCSDQQTVMLCFLASELAGIYARFAKRSHDYTDEKKAKRNRLLLKAVAAILDHNRSLDAEGDGAPAQSLISLDNFPLDELEGLQDPIGKELASSILACKVERAAHAADWNTAATCLEYIQDRLDILPHATVQKFAELFCSDLECPSALATQSIVVSVTTRHIISTPHLTNAQVLSESAAHHGRSDNLDSLKYCRAAITAALERGQHEDALRYVRNATELVDRFNKSRARSEIEWLATTAWNTGMDLLHADLDASSDWCKHAIQFGSFISGYGEMLDAMQAAHQNLHCNSED